jgi:hypothetical protein
MLIGRAVGGPRANVKLECPSTWDGRVRKPGPKEVYYPGRYEWKDDTWVWVDAMSSFVHRRNGNHGVCGAGYPWPSSILLTTNALKVTCPDCRGRMQRAQG